MRPFGWPRWARVAVVAGVVAHCRPVEPDAGASRPGLEVRLATLATTFVWSDGSASGWEATGSRLALAHEAGEEVPVRIVVVDADVTMSTLGATLDWVRTQDDDVPVSLAVDDGADGAAIRLTNVMGTRDPERVCAAIELDDDGRRVKIEVHEAWRRPKSGLYDARPRERQMFGSRRATPAEGAEVPLERHEDLLVVSEDRGEFAESLGERALARAFAASHPCPRASLALAPYLPWSRAGVHFGVLYALGVDEVRLGFSGGRSTP